MSSKRGVRALLRRATLGWRSGVLGRSADPACILEITTSVGCRNACRYCPQTALRQSYIARSSDVLMSLDTFARCIDRLPPETGIHFSGFSEPWQNPSCTQMVVHASRRGHPITVFTTGAGIRREDVEIIRTIPFRKFRVHLPDHCGFPGTPIDARYLQSVESLATAGIPDIGFVCPGVESPDGVHPAVTRRLRTTGTQLSERNFTSRGLISRAGAVPPSRGPKPVHRKGPLRRCPFLTKNVLLPNGDVALCCMDYELRHVLGNLLVEDYAALHSGEAFRQVLVGLSRGDSEGACRRCELARAVDPQGGQPVDAGVET